MRLQILNFFSFHKRCVPKFNDNRVWHTWQIIPSRSQQLFIRTIVQRDVRRHYKSIINLFNPHKTLMHWARTQLYVLHTFRRVWDCFSEEICKFNRKRFSVFQHFTVSIVSINFISIFLAPLVGKSLHE